MTESVWPFVAVVSICAAIGRLWQKTVGRRAQSALWYAFSTTFGAALFLISGSLGYKLQKGLPVFSDARWSDGVIWSQVNLGLAFLLAAVICWRRAIRDTDRGRA